MQGTMDILAMMQKSSITKQKSMAVSFSRDLGKSSFNRELAEAKRSNALQSTAKQSSEPAKQSSAKDNKVEKLAKVMSGSKAATEKAENTSIEATEDKQKLTDNKKAAEEQEAGGLKVDGQAGVLVEEAKPEQDTAVAELVESAQKLLEQLMQLINGTTTDKMPQEDLKQVEDSIQAITKKLEQILSQMVETKIPDGDVSLKDLKVELKGLIKQLKAQADEGQAVIVDKPNLQQKVDTIKQLVNKLNEIKPMLQQKLIKPEVMTENPEQKLGIEEKQSKNINKTDNSIIEDKPSDENVELKTAKAPQANENSDTEDKESKYKTDSKEVPKHQTKVDKHSYESFKTFNTLVNEKAGAQINVKELNLNQKKDQMITINKSDFVNQVVKKADIIVREGHSEMVMKLEPESLGKLNLKIVVEKGLITAKFIAESQQVKEVLESSFNQLKDALQEKGIAVQNFSVSVGQQAGDSGSNQSFDQWKQSLNIKSKATGEFVGLDDETVINQNPYSFHEGKFDYRA